MSRFESPFQVAGLFFIAAFVSVGLIFFINAEAQSRLSDNSHSSASGDDVQALASTSPGAESKSNGTLLHYLENSMKMIVKAVRESRWVNWNEKFESGRNEKSSEGGHRLVRRSTDSKLSSSGYYWNNGFVEEDRMPLMPAVPDYDTESGNRHPSESHPAPKSPSSNFHRIRHAVTKLGGRGLDLSVVERMILDSNQDSEINRRRESPGKIGEENSKHNGHRHHFEKVSREDKARKAFESFANGKQESLIRPTSLPSFPVASSAFVGEGYQYHKESGRSSQGGNEKIHFNRIHLNNNINEVDTDDSTDNDKRLSSTSRAATHKKNTITFPLTTDNSSGDDLAEDADLLEEDEPRARPKDSHKKSIHMENLDSICYKTDDVLIVVAITCCLNFAFVLVVWGCVRWFSVANTTKEKEFQQFDCEDTGDSILFRAEQEDQCWSSGNTREREREFLKHRIKRFGRPVNSTSLYSFRPGYVPHHCIQRSYSHSMEDLRYVHT